MKTIVVRSVDELIKALHGMMVPHAGVEPALLSESDFESDASTSSANGALSDQAGGLYHGLVHPRKSQMTPPPLDPIDALAEHELAVGRGAKVERQANTMLPYSTPFQKNEQRDVEENWFCKFDLSTEGQDRNESQWDMRKRLIGIRESLTLPGDFKLRFMYDSRDFFYAQIMEEDGVDNVTGEPMNWYGRKWLLSKHMTDSEIIQTVFKAVITAVEHEIREQFLYRGQSVFDPHYSLDRLVELRREKGSLERRAG